MNNITTYLRKHIFLLLLIGFNVLVFAVAIRINIFRFNNFDYGKFDLGNMTQMVWYTIHGKPLYLTDYFGSNVPRWSMSHVDPILLLFVPIFALFPHALTLVYSQIFLVLLCSIFVYKISELILENKLASFFLGLAFTLYPAVGFLIAWTGFHGVTAAMPFFLIAFYIYEYMYKYNKFTKLNMFLFWVFLVLNMTGKEQLPLYVLLYGFFIMFFRLPKETSLDLTLFKNLFGRFLILPNVKTGIFMVCIGTFWFSLAFFVIIPKYAHYRIESFNRFAQKISIDTSVTRDVESPNYFLSRYAAFGDSYTEVALGMLTHPDELVRVVFGGDKIENFNQTLKPLGYLPLLYPPLLLLGLPDFLINYATTQGGIGTSEIINHRVSMLIPVLFVALIFAISELTNIINSLIVTLRMRITVSKRLIATLLSFFILLSNIKTTSDYENPVFLWLTQAVRKRIALSVVYAKYDEAVASENNIDIGDVFKLSPLDNKDRECASKAISLIPQDASVSGPDYLGAHLATRETYAIFPALYDEADYVIVDVFSQKILRILELDVSIVKDVVADILKDPNYSLKIGCGNLFIFERLGPHDKSTFLPLQEKFEYPERVDLEIFQSLSIVDYEFSETFTKSISNNVKFVYSKRESKPLDDYVLFTSFVHKETGEIYQVANLPSFSLNQLSNWRSDRYYIENLEIAIPEFFANGSYKVFVGMTNNIRTRSIYLGDIELN